MKYQKYSDASRFVETSFWQSDAWRRILSRSGQAREVCYFGNPEGSYFLVEIRSLGMGFFGAFILGMRQIQKQDDFAECLAALEGWLRSEGVIFLQIEPLDTLHWMPRKYLSPWKQFLMPFTRVITLETGEEILKKMPQKGRYAVRNAEKNGVEIEIIEHYSDEILDEWMRLLDETTTRDNFSHNSRAYYQAFWQEWGEHIVVAAAKKDGIIISMAMIALFGDEAMYYYGASTSQSEYRRLASSYLLLWKTMDFAFEKGKKRYDLLGVADPNNPHDPLIGVSQFKHKLGGELCELPKKFLIPISWKYWVYAMLMRVKRMLWKK